MQLYTQIRFEFWKIMGAVVAVYIFFGLIGFAFMAAMSFREVDIDKMMTLKHISGQVLSLIVTAVFYFFTLNHFYSLITKKKPVQDFIAPFAIWTVILTIYFVVKNYVFQDDKMVVNIKTDEPTVLPVGILISTFVLSALFYMGISLLIAYLTFLRDEKKQSKLLQQQKMQLEVEMSQANLNFLKAQINPHFLHNTLNFLYAKALPLSSELSEGILTLSEIMRYALSEEGTKDGKVPLKDEIEHVRNVIKIQQLRFDNKLHVDLRVEGILNGATILPFMLITLVENAFKHGDLKSTENPIIINVKVEGNNVYFHCRNKKKTGTKELSTGIGLDNIKKRLDLAYGRNYQFDVKDEGDFYTTELKIFGV
ncbi:MAG: sensor histidine kinase [Candidatus Dadabacteria bacterium]